MDVKGAGDSYPARDDHYRYNYLFTQRRRARWMVDLEVSVVKQAGNEVVGALVGHGESEMSDFWVLGFIGPFHEE